MNKRKIILSLLLAFSNLAVLAQEGENKDFMESSGKIYVVMAVVVVIVCGLFLYLISLDRKISKIERNSKP
jgi:hypothetical protein